MSLLPDPAPSAGHDAPELCNGIDDNCDGRVDNLARDDPYRVVDAMVEVTHQTQTHYIYAYRASRPDAVAQQAGISGARACSRPGVQPWNYVSHAAAGAACAASGKRLCTRDEWPWACEGASSRSYPWGSTYIAAACNGADHDVVDDAHGGIDNGVLATGGLSSCKGELDIFDLSGNIKEWVDQPDYNGDWGGSFESPRLGLTCQTTLSHARVSLLLGRCTVAR